MILLLDRRIVIITPPKTASDSLHHLFCACPPWNGQCLIGRHHGVIDKHFPEVPLEADGFKVLLTVRNPYDRLVSLWLHKARLERYHGDGGESFAHFCGRLVRGEVQSWLWKTTIGELVGAQKIDGVLHVESLAEDLGKQGLAVESLPRRNCEWRKPWAEYYTPELLEQVKPWAAEDAEKWGYGSCQ